jgi:nucleoside-diphosphate-sugar epimerase
MTKLIFGCGYLGERVARCWAEAGERVVVVTRSAGRAHEFTRRGYTAIIADVTRPETLAELPEADAVVYSVGYDRSAAQSIETVYAGGLRNVLNALSSDAKRVIYVSTTGVYGPGDGEWVDEETAPDPRREGGRASLKAENALAAHHLGRNAVILRLAGIYGPGRVPFLDKLRAGEPIPAPTTGYLNLIHVEDAAAATFAAERVKAIDNGPRIYCISDGHPLQRVEFYCEAARQIGARRPSFIAPASDSQRALRGESNRRIRNERMRRELAVKLNYPNYRAGLAAVLETQNQ